MADEPTPSGKPEGNAPQEGSHFRHGGRGGVGLGAAVAGALQQGRLPLCDTPQHTCPCRLHFSD